MSDTIQYGLSKKTIENLHSIFSKFKKIDQVILYGSRAMGNFKTGSDIDLTLVGPSLQMDDLLRIEGEVDDLLLPYKVDLSLIHNIDDPEVLDHITRVGVVFYSA